MAVQKFTIEDDYADFFEAAFEACVAKKAACSTCRDASTKFDALALKIANKCRPADMPEFTVLPVGWTVGMKDIKGNQMRPLIFAWDDGASSAVAESVAGITGTPSAAAAIKDAEKALSSVNGSKQ